MPLFLLIVISSLTFISCASSHRINSDGDAEPDSSTSFDADLDGTTDTGWTADADETVDAEVEREIPPVVDCGYSHEDFGVREGQVLYPLGLWTCDETITSIPELACDNRAIIVHLSSAWCALCETATSMLLDHVMDRLTAQPVVLVEILVEGDHDMVATAENCQLWSERFSPTINAYIPPYGELNEEWSEIASVGAPPTTFLLDSQGVIRWQSNTVLPDRIDNEMARLLEHVRDLLSE